MRRRVFWATLLGMGLLALVACGSENANPALDGDSESEAEEAVEQEESAADSDPEPDSVDSDAPRPIGSFCAGDAACQSGFCLDDARLVQMMPSGIFVSLPHGMCTLLDCDAELPDARCPNNEGQHCVSLYALSADAASMALGMCLQTCKSAAECRLVDKPLCFDPVEWVKDGLLTEGDVLRYFAGQKVCLPESFKNALETISKNAKQGDSRTARDSIESH